VNKAKYGIMYAQVCDSSEVNTRLTRSCEFIYIL